MTPSSQDPPKKTPVTDTIVPAADTIEVYKVEKFADSLYIQQKAAKEQLEQIHKERSKR